MKKSRKFSVSVIVFATFGMILLSLSLVVPARAITYVSFSAVTSSYWTNVRSGPGTSYAVVRQIPPKTRVYFDAWTYGTPVIDLWLGTPDYRWYKVQGNSEWIASAVVIGNAPGSSPVPPAPSPPPSQDMFVSPVGAPCSSTWGAQGWYYGGYGVYNWYYKNKYHTGIDINHSAGDYGRPCYATATGTVVVSGYYRGWGNTIVIRHNSPVGTVYSLYAHLSARLVGSGAAVGRGTHIGNIGGTPNYSSHLHFEIKNQACVNSLGYLGPGYTPAHPNSYGYMHPYDFINRY